MAFITLLSGPNGPNRYLYDSMIYQYSIAYKYNKYGSGIGLHQKMSP